MAQPVYATPTELADWMGLGSPPDGADRWLRDASMDVDSLLVSAVYDVDEDDLPTDAAVAGALRDATTAQAEYLIAVGDRTGAEADKVRVKVDKVSVERATSPQTGRAVRDRYAARAVQVLRLAGLLPAQPGTWR